MSLLYIHNQYLVICASFQAKSCTLIQVGGKMPSGNHSKHKPGHDGVDIGDCLQSRGKSKS